MLEKEKLEIELLKEVLARYEAEQKELVELYSKLETKAQVTIVTSGIFITASGNLVKEVNKSLPPQINLFLACAIICLALSVACSVCVLLPREVRSSPLGSGYLKLTDDTLKFIQIENLPSNQEPTTYSSAFMNSPDPMIFELIEKEMANHQQDD